MDDYYVKPGKLKLKNDKMTKKKFKKKTIKSINDDNPENIEFKKDMDTHGGWWKLTSLNNDNIKGGIAIEVLGLSSDKQIHYLCPLDNGLFSVGPPHCKNEPPSENEIFLCMVLDDGTFSLKTGYNKYMGFESRGLSILVTAVKDAMGPNELWTSVFEDGKAAILGRNQNFLSIRNDEGGIQVFCDGHKALDTELLQIRCNKPLFVDPKNLLPMEERQGYKKAEFNYVKKFQSFQGGKVKLCEGDQTEIKRAKESGNLHETLLDRREKMKADRHCK